MKKLFAFITSFIAVASIFFVSAFQVKAATNVDSISNNTMNNNVSLVTPDIQSAFNGSIVLTQNQSGIKQFKIVDKEYFAESLKEAKASFNVNDVQMVLNKMNDKIKSDPEAFNFSQESIFLRRRSGNCSKALQFIGYVHAGAYAAAAAMLGVAGPASVIVPLVIGLVYQAGSLFC